jgi:hypothetical protein
MALAGALDYLLGDPGLRSRLVRAGRRKAAGLRWERIADAVEAAYQEACGLPCAEEPIDIPAPPAGGMVVEPASLRVTVPGMEGPREGSSD